MSNVQDWSTTAASNNAAAPNGFPEGMAPSGLNNSSREVMAAVKRWVSDTNGSISTTGASNAYVVTSNSSLSSLTDGDTFTIEPNHTNTGAATINVDSIGAVSVVDLAGNAVLAGMIQSGGKHRVVYDGSNFVLMNPYGTDGAFLPSGELFKRKTADEVRNNTTTFSADTHLTGFNLVASGVYEVDGQFFYGIPSSSNGEISIAFVFSSAPTVARGAVYCASQFSNVDSSEYQEDMTSTSPPLYMDAGNAYDDHSSRFRGLVVANAATTMALHWTQRSATAQDFTLQSGSYLRLRRLA